jgi:hypothetical protein
VDVFVGLGPAGAAGQLFAAVDLLAFPDDASFFGDAGFDAVDGTADVDPIDDGLLVAIFADDVFVEKGKGALVGGSGQADEEAVEVVEDLFPEVVDGAVTLVDDDKVEKFGRDFGVVDDGQRFFLVVIGLLLSGF